MESAEAKVRYVINTEVISVEARFKSRYISGIGKNVIMEQVSLGWFVFFQGSYEALGIGSAKPNLSIGDKIKITVEKIDAKPSQSPV